MVALRRAPGEEALHVLLCLANRRVRAQSAVLDEVLGATASPLLQEAGQLVLAGGAQMDPPGHARTVARSRLRCLGARDRLPRGDPEATVYDVAIESPLEARRGSPAPAAAALS